MRPIAARNGQAESVRTCDVRSAVDFEYRHGCLPVRITIERNAPVRLACYDRNPLTCASQRSPHHAQWKRGAGKSAAGDGHEITVRKRDRLEALRLAAIVQCVVDHPCAHDEDATERNGQRDRQRHGPNRHVRCVYSMMRVSAPAAEQTAPALKPDTCSSVAVVAVVPGLSVNDPINAIQSSCVGVV